MDSRSILEENQQLPDQLWGVRCEGKRESQTVSRVFAVSVIVDINTCEVCGTQSALSTGQEQFFLKALWDCFLLHNSNNKKHVIAPLCM